jgi:hypothetical protein
MAMYHTFYGPVDLPVPEPMRRRDRRGTGAAGIRVVRLAPPARFVRDDGRAS